MKVKRYVAKNMQEAIAKVKSDMGGNAVILHTRNFKEGGIFGFFQKSYVEVTAAAETRKDNISDRSGLRDISSMVNKFKLNDRENSKTVPQNKKAEAVDQGLSNELNEMKHMMVEMSSKLENATTSAQFPKLGQPLYTCLINQGVEDVLAKKIVRSTLQEANLQPQVSETQLKNIFMSNILKPLKNCKPISFSKRPRKPRIFVFVGPTGVGKTTTISKLAGMYAIMKKKRVAFVTIDTYRIAAVEQLKTIGDIMNVPVGVVYSYDQLEGCLKEYADCDLIFIDTAGRSHKNSEQIDELKDLFNYTKPDETFLVLSSTHNYRDLLDIIDTYKDIKVTRLIFTKLDETSFYGPIYNVACHSKIPLSYFTNGQNIPDDLEIADSVRLAQLLMKE